MKNVFLFLMFAIFAISCKKQTIVQDTTANVSNIENFNEIEGGEIQGIRLVTWAYWSDFRQDCLLGYWYCWEIDTDKDTDAKAISKDYINIHKNEKLITFGINKDINSEYHKKFIKGSNFNFPQDTYIRRSVVKATIGLDKQIFVKKGLYPFKINDGILTITAPYTILD